MIEVGRADVWSHLTTGTEERSARTSPYGFFPTVSNSALTPVRTSFDIKSSSPDDTIAGQILNAIAAEIGTRIVLVFAVKEKFWFTPYPDCCALAHCRAHRD